MFEELEKSEILMKVGKWIKLRFARFERIILVLIGVGLVIFWVPAGMNTVLLNAGIILLALLYYLMSFSPLQPIVNPGLENFTKYISYWGLSLVLIGIQFRISHFPGNSMMLVTGSLTLILAIGTCFYLINRQQELKPVYVPIITRALILIVLGLSLYLTPYKKLEELKLIKPYVQTESVK